MWLAPDRASTKLSAEAREPSVVRKLSAVASPGLEDLSWTSAAGFEMPGAWVLVSSDQLLVSCL